MTRLWCRRMYLGLWAFVVAVAACSGGVVEGVTVFGALIVLGVFCLVAPLPAALFWDDDGATRWSRRMYLEAIFVFGLYVGALSWKDPAAGTIRVSPDNTSPSSLPTGPALCKLVSPLTAIQLESCGRSQFVDPELVLSVFAKDLSLPKIEIVFPALGGAAVRCWAGAYRYARVHRER
jgi:hypothetical protein